MGCSRAGTKISRAARSYPFYRAFLTGRAAGGQQNRPRATPLAGVGIICALMGQNYSRTILLHFTVSTQVLLVSPTLSFFLWGLLEGYSCDCSSRQRSILITYCLAAYISYYLYSRELIVSLLFCSSFCLRLPSMLLLQQ